MGLAIMVKLRVKIPQHPDWLIDQLARFLGGHCARVPSAMRSDARVEVRQVLAKDLHF